MISKFFLVLLVLGILMMGNLAFANKQHSCTYDLLSHSDLYFESFTAKGITEERACTQALKSCSRTEIADKYRGMSHCRKRTHIHDIASKSCIVALVNWNGILIQNFKSTLKGLNNLTLKTKACSKAYKDCSDYKSEVSLGIKAQCVMPKNN
jgi:hypothetical protein